MEASVERASLAGLSLPQCPGKWIFGEVGCPGCGLTRAFVLSVHGHWQEAFLLSPAIVLVLLFSLGGALIHGDILIRGRMPNSHRRLLSLGQWVFAGGVILLWLLRWLRVF